MAIQVHLHTIWLLCAILVVTKVLGKSISTTSFEKDSVESISRCGVKNDHFFNQGRVRRSAVVGNHWNKTTITYWVVNGPHTPPGHNEVSLSKERIEELVTKAFEEWAPYCGLTFQVWKPNPVKPADITLSFERGNHSDGDVFDGLGNVVAHSTAPREQGSAIHFDDDEIWVDREISTEEANNGLASFYAVALHEIGHALGLSHSYSINSIMYAGSNWHVNSLNEIDITNIRNLYSGKNNTDIIKIYVIRIRYLPLSD